MTERQSLAVDYLKAVGIIAVVSGHYDGSFINFLRPYIFHMPLFFFVGGLLFKTGKKGGVFAKNLLVKYVFYIVVSYAVLWLSVCLLSNFAPRLVYPQGGLIAQTSLFIKSNFHSLPMFMVAWFLIAYMFVTLIGYFLIPGVENLKGTVNPELALCFIAIACGLLGMRFFAEEYAVSKQQIHNFLAQINVGLMFFLIGYAVRNHIYRFLNAYCFLLCFTVLLAMRKAKILDSLGMSWSLYGPNFFSVTLGALLCILFFFCVCHWLAGHAPIKLLRATGMHSKAIMSYHLLVFALLNILLAKMGFLSFDEIVTYSTREVPYTKYVFIAAGVLGPLFGSVLYEKIRSGIEELGARRAPTMSN